MFLFNLDTSYLDILLAIIIIIIIIIIITLVFSIKTIACNY
jgi:hypothetical protein